MQSLPQILLNKIAALWFFVHEHNRTFWVIGKFINDKIFLHVGYGFCIPFFGDALVGVFVRSKFFSPANCILANRSIRYDFPLLFKKPSCPPGMSLRHRAAGNFNQACSARLSSLRLALSELTLRLKIARPFMPSS